jgi:hypothetical protein
MPHCERGESTYCHSSLDLAAHIRHTWAAKETRTRVAASRVSPLYNEAVIRNMAAVIVGLLLASCGGGSLSLAEYNAEGMALGTAMEERIYALDAEWDTQTATVEDVRSYWDQRIEAYETALAGFEALEPTSAAAELHRIGTELFTRLVAAESALAARVGASETVTGPEQWWTMAEGASVGAVEEEIYSFCLVFQAMYDRTVERIAMSNAPWIPPEMKEIVQVDIGCETVRSDH